MEKKKGEGGGVTQSFSFSKGRIKMMMRREGVESGEVERDK